MSSKNKNDEIDWNKFTKEEKDKYESQRIIMFKYTFLVCIIYGSIAISVLIIGIFTEWGQKTFFNDLLPFIATYIIGSIIIILYLSNAIYNFRPVKLDQTYIYEKDVCPDYWRMDYLNDPEQRDRQQKTFLTNGLDRNHFVQKCSLNLDLINVNKMTGIDNQLDASDKKKKGYNLNENGNIYVELNNDKIKNVTSLNKPDDIQKFKTIAANMAGYTYDPKKNELFLNNANSFKGKGNYEFNNATRIPLACDRVYPLYLSAIDEENFAKNPSDPTNKYRCAFSDMCGLNWTDVGCGLSIN